MEHEDQYIGKTLGNRYRIDELIGVGGMASVYQAADLQKNGKIVAIKILNAEYNDDEKSVKRFVNESKAVSMLSHPNIVKIYDVAIERQINYFAMEYIDGTTLKDYVDYKKVLDWREAIYYISQVLSALGHAHEKGIIHRDIKPQNIMITREGVIKVMDFGIAKMINSESITMTDKALGTVDYISPEQASGKEVGYYSDIYSVGVMLYEMTTGTLPFIADTAMAVAMKQVTDDPTPPCEINETIPVGLEQVILKAMHKDPDERFSSCSAMEKALEILKADPTTVFSEHLIKSDKKKKTEDKEKKSSFLPVVAGVTLAFLITAGATAAYIGTRLIETGMNDNGLDIVIPELVGEIYSPELEETLAEGNIRILNVKYVSDPEHETGEILAQSPDGNSTRRLTDPTDRYDMTLTVNSGLQQVVLDDYSYTDYREAGIAIRALGLECIIEEQNDSVVMPNYVISTDPSAGEIVEAGGKVTLYVSKGTTMQTTKVPEIVGLDLSDAKKALLSANIRIGEITYKEDDETAGCVISSSLTAGTTVPQTVTKADLTVSLGNPGKVKKNTEDAGENEEQNEDESTITDEGPAENEETLPLEEADGEPEPV